MSPKKSTSLSTDIIWKKKSKLNFSVYGESRTSFLLIHTVEN